MRKLGCLLPTPDPSRALRRTCPRGQLSRLQLPLTS